jgi:hypothetical protein
MWLVMWSLLLESGICPNSKRGGLGFVEMLIRAIGAYLYTTWEDNNTANFGAPRCGSGLTRNNPS